MKLSRNVLVGSLATAGIVLGAVAPSLTAQAATTSAELQSDGTYKKIDNKEVASLNAAQPGVAIAYDGNGEVGTATAKSDANVTVINGLITLDKVPDFGFGTAAAGSKVDLQTNESQIDDDGNQSGLLQVTDSRTVQATKATAGFDLSAELGSFGASNKSATDPFILTLNPVQLTTSTGTGSDIVGQKTQAATLTEDAAAGATSNVMSLDAGKYNTGAIIAQFKATEGTPNANVQLQVPATANSGAQGDANAASSKSYKSAITWTLTPKAASTAVTGN